MQVYPQGRGMDDMAKSWTINGKVFEYIPLEDVKVAYNTIEPDLRKVAEKSYADWIPADVYAALRKGSSELYMVYEDNYYAGFVIVSILDDAGGEKTLYIWVAYSRPGYNIIGAGVEFLEGLIQNTSITGMEFHSDRSGWSRAAKKHGFKAVTTVYRKEI